MEASSIVLSLTATTEAERRFTKRVALASSPSSNGSNGPNGLVVVNGSNPFDAVTEGEGEGEPSSEIALVLVLLLLLRRVALTFTCIPGSKSNANNDVTCMREL